MPKKSIERRRPTPEALARHATEAAEAEKPRRPKNPAFRKLLTDNLIANLPAKKRSGQYLVHDAGTGAARGLAVLVSRLGTKSYRCVFYFRGSPKPYWMNLGRVDKMTLEEAREKTRVARRTASPANSDTQPQDPRDAKPTSSGTFEAVVADYIKHKQIGEKGNASALKTQAVILYNAKDWLTRPIATIRADEIEKLLWRVRDGGEGRRPAPYMANRLHAHLHDFFKWASRRSGPLKESPMLDIAKPWSGEKGRDREWFKGQAANDAIKSIWKAADEISGDEGRYLKLLLITGKRPWGRENGVGLGAIRWEHITPDWFWDAPPSKVRNKRLHGVPLPNLAQRVLHPRQAEGWVFGDIDNKKLKQTVRRLTGIKDFIPHGIRHLVETKMQGLHDEQDRSLIFDHMRDLLLDHASQRGAGKGYAHHDYKTEMRAAMEAWAEHIEKLVQPAEGVMRLR